MLYTSYTLYCILRYVLLIREYLYINSAKKLIHTLTIH